MSASSVNALPRADTLLNSRVSKLNMTFTGLRAALLLAVIVSTAAASNGAAPALQVSSPQTSGTDRIKPYASSLPLLYHAGTFLHTPPAHHDLRHFAQRRRGKLPADGAHTERNSSGAIELP